MIALINEIIIGLWSQKTEKTITPLVIVSAVLLRKCEFNY